ncbi:MAG: cytochrome P460 family protein [Phycisphaeraceae bacterium]
MHRLAGFALGLLVLLVAGCAYFGVPTGQDRVEAQALEGQIADYKTWQTPDWVDGYQPSRHPVPKFVRYYVNAKGMSDIDNPPDGAIFVKEQFDQDKQFINLTVMKKIDGYDPENGDWYWAITDDQRRVTNAGKLDTAWTSSCISCHKKGDGGGDLLFVND